ncbi:MAG: hypothetical protein U0075_03480 [Thermomicrobiales bacterium]
MRLQLESEQQIVALLMALDDGLLDEGREVTDSVDILDAGNLAAVTPAPDQQVLKSSRYPD